MKVDLQLPFRGRG